MKLKNSKWAYVLPLFLIISPGILSTVLNQHFLHDINSNFEISENSVPLVSTVNSELEVIWNYTYGEYKDEAVKSLVRLPNGNYIISGYINDSGSYDIMIRCFASNGTSLWNRTFGYVDDDYGFEVIGCNSGGVAVVGRITNTTALYDNNDVIIIRIAVNGTQMWNCTYIGPEQTATSIRDDRAYSILECANEDLVVAGLTSTTNEGSNVWLFRVNSTGTMLWNRTYHNWDTDRCFEPNCLVQTNDNGFAIAGYTYNDTQSNDVWLIRTNSAGLEIWNHTYGAIDEYQRPNALVECSSGGFAILAANKTSGSMYTNAWIIRTDIGGIEIWNRTYGGEESDGASKIMEMPDGGFVFVGATHSFDIGQGDLWLVRTYANGSYYWNHTVGTPYGENGGGFVYEGNGIYTIAGHHNPVGMPGSVIWLIKVKVNLLPSSLTLTSTADNPDYDGIFSLNWTIPDYVINYSVYQHSSYISKINGSVSPLEEGLTNNSKSLNGYATGTYYFIIEAFNDNGSTLSNCIMVEVVISEGGIPFGNFYLFMAIIGIIGLIVYIKRKL